ncbi:hypothetical protein Cylst_0077 [Cylindrospermum stagnale PCC 7417]|uniref:eCIS core domain-containing protein n=1 Tax=Cylindrospermum stagnale PCC 7417 TaxID=56107 RepID=K9WQJ0_9NOST|nr:DUF4157 domain-containing protein [Cylindrospermum stagnale]AFZ22458.1 hypothetical protein Cylst_0077 [Cylindrospermum stagnale PCC 7417]
MSKSGGKTNAAAWQPTTQAASKSIFTSRPFPEIVQREQETAGNGEKAAQPVNRRGSIIENINRSMSKNSIPAVSNAGIVGVQAKLTIGEPGDQYEQEADRVAAEVVQKMNAPAAPGITAPPREDGFDKSLQRKPVIPILASRLSPGVEMPLMRQNGLRASHVPDVQADFETKLNQARGGGGALDAAFRAKIEPVMGADFSGVRVHTDSGADEMSQSIQAKAFTTGQDVFFRQGAYEPGSSGGQELIAHELTHVVQQNGGAVQRVSENEEEKPKEETKQNERGTVILPQAVFQELDATQYANVGSNEICEAVQPLLTEYLAVVRYNSLEDAAAYLDHLNEKRKEDKGMTPQKAFQSFSYQSTLSIEKAKGSQCVGQGIQFADQVRQMTKLPAYPCAATFAGKEYYGHGAAMIAFKNAKDEKDAGYILMDPGFNVNHPIVVTKEIPAKVRSSTYKLDESGSIKSYGANDEHVVTFQPQQILNPDEAITKSALLAYNTFTVVARSGKDKIYIQLDLRQEKLIAVYKKKKLTSDLEEIEKIISEELAEVLGYERGQLLETLKKVIQGKEEINKLQDSTIEKKQEEEYLD